MLTRLALIVCVAIVSGVVAAAAMVLVADPAVAQYDPSPINCDEEPTAVECQDQPGPPGEGGPGNGGGRVCRFNGTEVPCNTRFGSWVGDAVDGDWYGIHGDTWPAVLVGCWASPIESGREPPSTYPGEATSGTWYTLSCLGPGGTFPDPGPTQVGTAWTPAAVEEPPDPEELARMAFASITLRAPRLLLSPPESGSVPLGMPVWLAIEESSASWGPISSGQVCDAGLCVEVTAQVLHVDWSLGDGTEIRCTREQHRQWRPGMDFLAPGNACHHYYTALGSGRNGGGYRVSATATWRAQWSGGGQSGVFDGVTDACGTGSDELCQSTASVTVEEIQVLVR